MKMDSDTDGSGGALPNPILSLKLYRRCFKGRKQLFSQSNDAAANYFITNPVPHKHSNCWRPVFYRGDNPKYTPNATAIGRARRSAMWGSFRIWLGDGVQEVLDNKKRRQERRKAERKNKWRKIFGKKKRPVDVEEEKEVQGMVVMFRMQRTGFLTRSLELEVQGVRYRWSGTRMFATGLMKRFKGWSHSMKLIRMSDRALIATFEKDLIGSRRSIKTGGPPNKSKRALGKLRIYDCPDNITSQPMRTQQDQLTSLMAHVDAATTMPSDIKDEKDLNPGGVHSGNLTEEAVVFTCWIAVEAEHRLRYKIPDLIEEIGEQIDGG